jgi:RNA polymerase sigma-70 factor (ECF subfamily)
MTEPVRSDSKLVKKLKEGDVEAFNQLFYAYSSRLYHFAYGYLKSKDKAEEMVQEIFLKIWENRGNIKEEFQFRSYLFSIAFNYVKKYFRTKALINRYIDYAVSHGSEEEYPDEETDYSSLKSRVYQLVEQMPEKRREVFIKSRFEGKNAVAIAEELNLSQSTVENHLNLALRFLKQQLKGERISVFLFFCLFIQ